MKNKVFFFDIDGTLAVRGNVPQSNIEVLKLLKEKGYLTFICTGRAPFYAQKLFSGFVSGYITCNGRYIIYDGQKLHGENLTKDELKYYKDKMNSLGCGALFATDEQSHAYYLDEQQIEKMKKEYGADRIDIYNDDVSYYTFDLFYSSKKQYQSIVEEFKNDLIINDHGGMGHCDCSTLNYDKGHAIKYILDYFKISKDDAFAFGDGFNDQAMFREVTNKIAMGNAVGELKDKASFITDTVNDEGIMKALKHYHIL